MSHRGVIYLVWNRPAIEDELQVSIRSVERIGLPYHVFEGDSSGDDWSRNHSQKASIYDLSPFEETLFLDSDTEVLGDDLSFGFDKAARHGIAMCFNPACLACRSGNRGGFSPHAIEYNTGVIFFRKSPDVQAVFEAWKRHIHLTDADQPGFAKAMDETGFNPFVLPNNWNYRAGQDHQCFGPVNIWHSRRAIPRKWDNRKVDYKLFPREYSIKSLKRRIKRLLKISRGQG